MAVKKPRTKKSAGSTLTSRPLWRWGLRWLGRGLGVVAALYLLLIFLFSFLPPPGNIYQWQESWRLGGIQRQWVSWDKIAPEMGRSAVAGEDANFCLHWGFDMAQIRDAIARGSRRGASTISQQVAKNVFLWQGRSYVRKAMEAVLTPVIELMWSKQRILEVYLNEAEFAEGVFGVQAAAEVLFKTDAAHLTPVQAARLAAVLPDPKNRHAAKPSAFVRSHAAEIQSGADTIEADGRAACFETAD
ncbi:monofunctional biosynthetic peptidoglycan transglycosylase [bacterium]|nr:monofunctional biosynthetic peptidoglycan transglycosylase [bacterium]